MTFDNRPPLPGSVSLDYIELSSSNNNAFVNITELVYNIDIFEDIHSPFIYGKLHIFDTQNIINTFPLLGEESVKIKFSTDWIEQFDENEVLINTSNTTSSERTFWVYSLSDRIKTANQENYYVLHFVSHEIRNDMFYKISRSFRGQVSEIAKQIYSDNFYYSEKDSFERDFLQKWLSENPTKTKLDYIKDKTTDTFTVEDTVNSIKYISNYWSPSVNLNYLSKLATSKNHNTQDFVFFDSLVFGHSFMSISQAIYRSTVDNAFKFTYIADNYNSASDTIKTYNRINSWKVNTQHNFLERYNYGMIGAKIISHDILNKKFTIDTIKYGDLKSPKLNENNLQTTKPYPYPVNDSGYGIFITNGISDNFNGKLYTQQNPINKIKRLMRLEESVHGKSMNISIHGRVDLTLLDVVNLSIFKSGSITIDDHSRPDLLDLSLSGNYLVTAIKHNITKTGYEMFLELCSDSSIIKNISTLNSIIDINSEIGD